MIRKIIIMIMIFYAHCLPQNFITYCQNGGRFGDQLSSYIYAKWLAHKHKYTLLYKPFIYSNQLALHNLEAPYKKSVINHLKSETISCDKDIRTDCDNVLYIVPYLSHYPKSEKEAKNAKYPIVIDWDDYAFVDLLRMHIAPMQHFCLPVLDKSCLNVAIHVRTGSGNDKFWGNRNPKGARGVFSDIELPLNVPREEFYVKQIAWLANLFKHCSIYFYIFTDNPKPKNLCAAFQQKIPNANICFYCCSAGNRGVQNVLEDFFAMQQFDCIICPNSNYSIAAAKIGKNAITIFPVEYEWNAGDLIMTRAKVAVKLRELQFLVDRQLMNASELFRLLTS